jgi:hypothetical protein
MYQRFGNELILPTSVSSLLSWTMRFFCFIADSRCEHGLWRTMFMRRMFVHRVHDP